MQMFGAGCSFARGDPALHNAHARCMSPPAWTGFWNVGASRELVLPCAAGCGRVAECPMSEVVSRYESWRVGVPYVLFGSAGRGLFGGGPGQGGYLEPEGIVVEVYRFVVNMLVWYIVVVESSLVVCLV